MEIERLEVQFSEQINQQQSRFNSELSSLREQLQEAETHRDILQREVREFHCSALLVVTLKNEKLSAPTGS